MMGHGSVMQGSQGGCFYILYNKNVVYFLKQAFAMALPCTPLLLPRASNAAERPRGTAANEKTQKDRADVFNQGCSNVC
jgi:hypothetical protein